MRYIRIAIFLLLGFELFSLFGLLPYKPSYAYFGLIFMASVVWTIFEWHNWYAEKHYQYIVPAIAMFPGIIGLYLDAMGDFTNWYGEFWWYDIIVHTLNGFATGAFLWYALFPVLHKKLTARMHNFTAIMFALAGGAFLELEEYFEDFFTGSQRLGDGFDTANDLFNDLVGATLAVMLLYFITRPHTHYKQPKP